MNKKDLEALRTISFQLSSLVEDLFRREEKEDSVDEYMEQKEQDEQIERERQESGEGYNI